MVRHHGNMRSAFQNLRGEHGQGSLWTDFNKDPTAGSVHGFDLLGPFHRRGHLGGKLSEDAGLGIFAILRVKVTVDVRGDGNAWPTDLELFQKSAQRFVGGSDDA